MSKLHGVTKIELYNPNTKIKEIVRSENTFQNNILASALSNLGAGATSILGYGRSTAWWTDIVGGILLFRDTIQVGNKYMPDGNQMIGNACYGYSNASLPNELGSFNLQESSASPSAITQVYDFTTNQGNGQISCVCLTSQAGGFTGYGNPSGDTVGSANTRQLLSQNNIISLGQNGRFPRYESVDNGGNLRQIIFNGTYYRIDAFDNSTKKFTFFKTKVPVRTATVFDEIHETITIDASNAGIPSNFSNLSHFCLVRDKNKAYLVPANAYSVASGSTFYFWELDFEELTITKKTVTNSAGVAINGTLSIACGCLFAYVNASNNWKTYIFDIETGVHKSTLTHSQHIIRRYFYWSDKIAILLDYFNHTYLYNVSFIDIDNGYVIPSNGSMDLQNTHYIANTLESDCIFVDGRYNAYVYNNPLYLATINNLQSPVTKTSAQTMKVTYTLTES